MGNGMPMAGMIASPWPGVWIRIEFRLSGPVIFPGAKPYSGNADSSAGSIPARRFPFHGADLCAFHLAHCPRVSLPDGPGQIPFRNG